MLNIEEESYFLRACNPVIWQENVLHKYIDPETSITIFEIGTCIGSSAIWMSENLCLHPESIIHTAGVARAEVSDYATELLSNYNNINYYNNYGSEVIKQLDQNYDLIYIDGHHSFESVLEDARCAIQYLKPEGIIIFDDYEDAWEGVVRAVDTFVAECDLTLETLSKTQVLVKLS
jgi:predicted O-methyltransferase YrrM